MTLMLGEVVKYIRENPPNTKGVRMYIGGGLAKRGHTNHDIELFVDWGTPEGKYHNTPNVRALHAFTERLGDYFYDRLRPRSREDAFDWAPIDMWENMENAWVVWVPNSQDRYLKRVI